MSNRASNPLLNDNQIENYIFEDDEVDAQTEKEGGCCKDIHLGYLDDEVDAQTEKEGGCCKDIHLGTYVLVAMFGISSWVAINGVFVEQPLLVAALPEGWTLPSYLAVAVQIGNISIFVTTFLHEKFSDSRHQIVVIYVMIITSIVAIICLSFFWDYTANIANEDHSVPLIFLVFILSLISCSSSVVYLPFMANFKSQYMNAFFIGEGMSGFLPSLLALAQGVGKGNCENISIYNNTANITYFKTVQVDEKIAFSVSVNILIIAAITVISVISFSLLNFSSFCKDARVIEDNNQGRQKNVELVKIKTITDMDDEGHQIMTSNKPLTLLETNTIQNGNECVNPNVIPLQKDNGQSKHQTKILQNLSFSIYGYFLLLTAWINALEHGILLSVQPYSTLPYGRQTYHLAVVLSNMVDPVACFVAEFVPAVSGPVISLMTVFGSLIAAYIVFLASWSPYPIPVGIDVGSMLSIVSWVAVIFILTFAKVCIVGIIRNEGKKALLWCGVTKQLGASVGAAVMYVLINVSRLLKSIPTCG